MIISDNVRMIEELVGRMAALLEPMQAAGDPRRYFHATYQRTTIAVAEELKRGGFADQSGSNAGTSCLRTSTWMR